MFLLSIAAIATTYGDLNLEHHTGLNSIIETQNRKPLYDSIRSAISSYMETTKFEAKFPFPYFYRPICIRMRDDRHKDIDTAQILMRKLVQIPGYQLDHQELLVCFDRDEF
jgi:hypothetical protein